MDTSYDVIVIGGGSAGTEAAKTAALLGQSTLLIEREDIGGTCLKSGCIPSKFYLSVAASLHGFEHRRELGMLSGHISGSFETVQKRQSAVVDALMGGTEADLKACRVDILKATARVMQDPNGLRAYADGTEYNARNVILANGSRPRIPVLEGIRDEIASGFVYTNENLFLMEKQPQSMAVIGAGVSGVELAWAFSEMGTEVTLIEELDRILAPFDEDVRGKMLRMLAKSAVTVICSAKVEEICEGSVVYLDESGEEQVLDVESVFVGIGREASKRGILLDGLDYDEKGFVKTDEFFRTSIPHVYAVGDINGRNLTAHSAICQGRIAAEHAASRHRMQNGEREADRPSGKIIPSVIYTDPECVCVGKTESELKKKNRSFRVVKLPMNYSGRYAAECGEFNSDGMIKLIFDENSVLIGAAMVSLHASEISFALELMIEGRFTARRMLEYVYPHPTESEMIRTCALQYLRETRT